MRVLGNIDISLYQRQNTKCAKLSLTPCRAAKLFETVERVRLVSFFPVSDFANNVLSEFM